MLSFKDDQSHYEKLYEFFKDYIKQECKNYLSNLAYMIYDKYTLIKEERKITDYIFKLIYNLCNESSYVSNHLENFTNMKITLQFINNYEIYMDIQNIINFDTFRSIIDQTKLELALFNKYI